MSLRLVAAPGSSRGRTAGEGRCAMTGAQRNLFNRLLGCLYHCLQTGQRYDETTAFPNQAAAKTAA